MLVHVHEALRGLLGNKEGSLCFDPSGLDHLVAILGMRGSEHSKMIYVEGSDVRDRATPRGMATYSYVFNRAATFKLKPLPFARCCNREPCRCRSGAPDRSIVSRWQLIAKAKVSQPGRGMVLHATSAASRYMTCL